MHLTGTSAISPSVNPLSAHSNDRTASELEKQMEAFSHPVKLARLFRFDRDNLLRDLRLLTTRIQSQALLSENIKSRYFQALEQAGILNYINQQAPSQHERVDTPKEQRKAEIGSLPPPEPLKESGQVRANVCLDVEWSQDGSNPLIKAFKLGWMDQVTLMLNRAPLLALKKFIRTPNPQGFTPFLLACLEGDLKMAHFFYVLGADPLQITKGKVSSLHLAVRAKNDPLVAFLLKITGDKSSYREFLNCQDEERGSTALIDACAHDQRVIARRLCEAGSDPKIRLNNGSLALHLAARKGALDVIKNMLAPLSTDERATLINWKNNPPSSLTAGDLAQKVPHHAVVSLLDHVPTDLECVDLPAAALPVYPMPMIPEEIHAIAHVMKHLEGLSSEELKAYDDLSLLELNRKEQTLSLGATQSSTTREFISTIGEKKPMNQLIDEFPDGEKGYFNKEGAQALSRTIQEYYPIARDGHCLFRTIAAGLIRNICQRPQIFVPLMEQIDAVALNLSENPSNIDLVQNLEEIKLKLNQMNFGDENSWIHLIKNPAFSDFMVKYLRKLAVAYIRKHDLAVDAPFETDAEKESYCARMIHSNEYGGHSEIFALAKIFKMKLTLEPLALLGKEAVQQQSFNRSDYIFTGEEHAAGLLGSITLIYLTQPLHYELACT